MTTASTKSLTVLDIQCKAWTRYGTRHEGEVMKGHHAAIEPGKSITLFGEMDVYQNGSNVIHVPYERKFVIGDVAEYDSYNLSYTGSIVAIGKKTVTIQDHGRNRVLDLANFSRRNRDFDAEKTAKRNSEWMD